MEDAPMNLSTRNVVPTPAHIVELERLGDEIAKLSAHLDAATARLLDLIREFDARGGWGNGFLSCAHGLTWRVGLEPRADAGGDAPDRRAPAQGRAGRHRGGRPADPPPPAPEG